MQLLAVIAITKGRKQDNDGDLVGKENANPILDTRFYVMEILDEKVEEFNVNTTLENITSQVDSDS